MGTSTYDFEGTTGASPGSATAGYGTVAWYSAPAGTSTDAAISTTAKHGGSKSVSIATTATNAVHYCSSPAATTYVRGYAYLSIAPSNDTAIAYLYGSGFAYGTQVGITTDRRFYAVHRGVGGTVSTGGSLTAANACPLNEWFRFEAKLDATSCEIRVWKTTGGSGLESTGTADHTQSQSGTSIGTLDQVGIGAFAINSSGTAVVITSGNFYIDDIAVSDGGAWLGPSTSTVTGSAAGSETFTGEATATKSTAATAAGTLTVAGSVTPLYTAQATSFGQGTFTGAAEGLVTGTPSTQYGSAAATATTTGAADGNVVAAAQGTYLYNQFLLSASNAEIDWDSGVVKAMLVGSAYAPDADVHRYKSSVTSEASGSGYTAGGVTITGASSTYAGASNTVTLSCSTITFPAASVTFRYIVFYKDTGSDATSPLICWVDTGSSRTTANESVVLTPPAGGLVNLVGV